MGRVCMFIYPSDMYAKLSEGHACIHTYMHAHVHIHILYGTSLKSVYPNHTCIRLCIYTYKQHTHTHIGTKCVKNWRGSENVFPRSQSIFRVHVRVCYCKHAYLIPHVCMYVCMYVCMLVCISVCVYVCTWMQLMCNKEYMWYKYIHTYAKVIAINLERGAYIHAVCAHMHLRAFLNLCRLSLWTPTHTHTHTHTHTYIHTKLHTYIPILCSLNIFLAGRRSGQRCIYVYLNVCMYVCECDLCSTKNTRDINAYMHTYILTYILTCIINS